MVPQFDSAGKLFFLFVLGMGLPLILEAQSDGMQSSDSETIRVFGGVNRAYLSGADEFSSQDPSYLPLAGISYTYFFNDTYGFSLGLTFETKGTQKVFSLLKSPPDGTYLGDDVTFYHRFNYISLPIQGVYRIYLFDNVAVKFRGGFYYSYLLKIKQFVPFHVPIERIKYINRSDFGLQAGVEALHPIGQDFSLSLQLLHSAGIRNIEDSEGFISPIRTNATQVSLGLVYEL